jgi:pimeloyl-ACP methyl ester carboxylesterase
MKAFALLVLGYGLIVAFMYGAQTSMIFPGTRLPSRPLDQPMSPKRLSIEVEAGVALAGLAFSPKAADGAASEQHPSQRRELLIAFGGNAQDADVLGQELAQQFPAMDIVVFHYRGYGDSTGSPSEDALFRDALAIFDHAIERFRPDAVYAMGISLGSGVAAYLSKERVLTGVLLVTPYDSIENVAKNAYPWLPVGLLLKHRFDSTKIMSSNTTPAAIVAAANDQVIRPERTDALRKTIPNLVFDKTIEEAGHGDIHGLEVYWEALRAALVSLRAAAERSEAG